MAVCCYAEGVALFLFLLAVTVTTEDYSDRYDVANEEKEQAELGDFMRNVLRHKDDFRWIEKNADREHLGDGIVRYEKDIEPRIRERQSSIRDDEEAEFDEDHRRPLNNFDSLDYEEEEEEDNDEDAYHGSPRSYHRRIPGGFRSRRRKLHRRNRNKRGLGDDYDPAMNDVEVIPQGQYGMREVPGKRQFKTRQLPLFQGTGESTVVVDDLAPDDTHDILGLKKYQERNRKKVLVKEERGLNKRSIYFDNIHNGMVLPKLPQTGLVIRSFEDNPNPGPITSRFEGLKYPNISEVMKKLEPPKDDEEKKENCTSECSSTTESTQGLFRFFRFNSENPSTYHVHSLEEITHPTSAIEQKLLASEDPLAQSSAPLFTSLDLAEEASISTSEIETQLPYYLERRAEDAKGQVSGTSYRAKGAKPRNQLQESKKVKHRPEESEAYDYEADDKYYDENDEKPQDTQQNDYPEGNRKRQEYEPRGSPPYYQHQKQFFHSRSLLGAEEPEGPFLAEKIDLPTKVEMTDLLMKAASGEGEGEDEIGDPYVGKKLKYDLKKKQSFSFNSGGLEVDGADDGAKSKTTESIGNEDMSTCGMDKGKVYCNTKADREDEAIGHKTTKPSPQPIAKVDEGYPKKADKYIKTEGVSSSYPPPDNFLVKKYVNDFPPEIREESDQDIIEAGFRMKASTAFPQVQPKKAKYHRIRLNRYGKNGNLHRNLYQDDLINEPPYFHKRPKFMRGAFKRHRKFRKHHLKPLYLNDENDHQENMRKTRSFNHLNYIQVPHDNRKQRNEPNETNTEGKNCTSTASTPSAATEIYSQMNSHAPVLEYIGNKGGDMDQIKSNINTELAGQVVDQIFEAMKSNQELASSLARGLCKQAERQKYIMEITALDRNFTNADLKDTESLLQQLMTAINNIIAEKVKARMCRKLPKQLQCYLRSITKIHNVKKHEGESSAENLPLPPVKTRSTEDDEHPDADQPDFLFYNEANESPELKKTRIKAKMHIVKTLLDEYEQMSKKCRIKMRFVRDYLEKNLAVLQALYERCSKADEQKKKAAAAAKTVQKKHTTHPKAHKANQTSKAEDVDEELQKIGWEQKGNKLLTDYEVSKILHKSMRNAGPYKRELPDAGDQWGGSEQYKRLVAEVEKEKKKQEKDEKLGKLFGEKRSVRNENYDSIRSQNKEMQELGRFSFEEPVVFSADN